MAEGDPMPKGQRVTRNLKAILSADVEGYSRLMSEDEAHTIQTLKMYRNNRFRIDLKELIIRYKETTIHEKRELLKSKIMKINKKIIECKRIWEQFAPPENWDQ